jgi:hypothetical protein
MHIEMETAQNFINYLKSHGYPENTIAVEYLIDKKYRVDVAVLDLDKNIPIQLFEIKSQKNNDNIRIGIEQLIKFRSNLNNSNIPSYLVFPIEREPYFEVINIDAYMYNRKAVENENLILQMNFKAQRVARIAEESSIIKQKKEKIVDTFKIACWAIAFFMICIGILSNRKIITLNATDLTFLGVVIVLILLPFASKLKILGVEFERLSEKIKN